MKTHIHLFVAALLLSSVSLKSQISKNLTVHMDEQGAAIQPTMWGVFFEDINFAADGGIYAELVKNRSFEFYQPMMGWEVIKGNSNTAEWMVIHRDESHSDNPSFLRVISENQDDGVQLVNHGFRGMGIRENESYRFSMLGRRESDSPCELIIELLDSAGNSGGASQLEIDASDWTAYEARITSTITDPNASLRLQIHGPGDIDLDMISLFPESTWKNRRNGLRADLVQMIADLEPGFIRFPGGCIVEGRELANRYQWKKTVGPVEERKVIVNRWNSEFSYRPAPDYFQSYGLGFYEYFLLAEDLGAEPVPILNCGMACQFNTGQLVPLDELDPYLQDALDLIEFANGPVESAWGALRAEMGHPEPFDMKYLGVGNEQWGPQYVERFRVFRELLSEKYPEITIIAGSGPYNRGEWFEYLWSEFSEMKVDMIDEHYYAPPDWFRTNATRYDDYDRDGPIIFAGEFAAHGPADDRPESRNTWESALAEAAYMTGLERNADIVHLASYAPLLAHVNAWQWRPDLIWFDNLRVVGTPNYYVQKLFSTNRGTHVVPVTSDNQPLNGLDSLYSSAVFDQGRNEVVLKLVNTSTVEFKVNLDFPGAALTGPMQIQELSASALDAYNNIDDPRRIYPQTAMQDVSRVATELTLQPRSLTVVRAPCAKE